MHRIVGLLPGGQMALRISAVGGRNRQRIVVIDVAKIAGHVGMAVGQREAGGVVIENSRGPGGDGVACRAGRSGDRESSGHVIGNVAADGGSALEGGLVASVAIRRVQHVVIVDVAGGAGRGRRRHVRAGQREAGSVVIEDRRGPAHRVVARRAIPCRERRARSGVHRIIGLLPGGQVALRVSTVGRRDGQTVVVVDVAERAGHVGVAVGQLKAGGAVIENSRVPTRRVVARRTVRH